jgi:PGF-CTERM protein
MRLRGGYVGEALPASPSEQARALAVQQSAMSVQQAAALVTWAPERMPGDTPRERTRRAGDMRRAFASVVHAACSQAMQAATVDPARADTLVGAAHRLLDAAQRIAPTSTEAEWSALWNRLLALQGMLVEELPVTRQRRRDVAPAPRSSVERPQSESRESSTNQAGFGAAVAVLALGGALALGSRRRS